MKKAARLAGSAQFIGLRQCRVKSSWAGVLEDSISCGDVTSSGSGLPNLLMTIGDRAPLSVEEGN